MSMHDATNIAASWLEWGSAYSLPEPSYVTVSQFGGIKAIKFQFDQLGHVHDWARYLRTDANGHAKDGDLFTRAEYKTGDYSLECYSVTPFTPSQPTLDEVAPA